MKNEENKLEQLMKQRLNAQHNAFNEAHWLSARKLIDADRKRKRNKGFFLFASAFLAVTSCVAFFMWLLQAPGNPVNEPGARSMQQPVTAATVTTPPAGKNAPVATAPLPASSNREEDQKTTTLPAPANAYTPAKQITNDRTAKSKKTNAVTPAEKTPKDARSEGAAQVAAQTGATAQKQERSKSKPGTGVRSNTQNPAAVKQEETASEDPVTASPVHDESLAELATVATGQASGISNQTGTVNTRKQQTTTFINPKYTERLSYNWLAAPDSSPTIPAPLRPLKARNSFIAQEVGATYFNPGKNAAEAINLSVGLMYYFGVNARVGINAGVFYSRIHQDLPARVYSNTSYDFGKSISFTSVQTLRLDYLELPLQAYYRPTPAHMIRAGISYLHLLQSAELVTRSGAQTRENGYVDAINKSDVLLSAGYTWLGKAPFFFSLTGYYGLNDISDNTVFHSTSSDRNAGIKVSIGYTLRQLR